MFVFSHRGEWTPNSPSEIRWPEHPHNLNDLNPSTRNESIPVTTRGGRILLFRQENSIIRLCFFVYPDGVSFVGKRNSDIMKNAGFSL